MAAIRTFTQEDPIGLAGGLNLYGFAGGDPVNFSDPFGLCRDGDEVCALLVSVLQTFDGDHFRKAARLYEETQRRVRIVSADHRTLRDPRSSKPALGVTVGGSRGTVYLNGDLSGIDQVVTAAHEALYHIDGETALMPNNAGHIGIQDYDMDRSLVREAANHPLRLMPEAFIQRLEDLGVRGAADLRKLYRR